jgi:hypothetical protein
MSVNGRNDKKRYTMYLPSNNVGIKQCCKVVLLNGVTLNGGCSCNYHNLQYLLCNYCAGFSIGQRVVMVLEVVATITGNISRSVLPMKREKRPPPKRGLLRADA